MKAPTSSFALALTLALAAPSSAQCPNDNGLNNNTLADAVQLQDGFSRFEAAVDGIGGGDLTTPNTGNDYFIRSLSPGEVVRCVLSRTDTSVPLSFEFGNAGGSLTSGSITGGGLIFNLQNNDPVLASIYTVRVIGESAGCTDYVLETIVGSCPNDDTLSASSCASAIPLTTYTEEGLRTLSVQSSSDDWFQATLQPGATLDVELLFRHSRADVDLEFYDASAGGSCGSLVGSSTSSTNGEDLTYTNTTPGFMDIRVRAFWYDGAFDCNDYQLEYEITGGTPDDAFEDNDTLCTATAAPRGVTPDFVVSQADPDFFRIDVNSFEEFVCAIDFTHADGDLDLALWDEGGNCVNPFFVADSQSTTNYEEVRILASTSPETYLLQVLYFPQDGGSNTYTMTIAESSGSGLGSSICEGVPNTTGHPGRMRALGSVAVQDNNMRLIASDVPSSVFGFFNGSQNTGFVANPGGSQGNLCIAGGFIARFVGPGQIVNTGSGGFAEITPNLQSMPSPTGTSPVAVGDTWYFQFWHRDAIGGVQTSNFTEAMRVRFE